MERKIDKKDNFFSIELRDGEEVTISINDGSGKPDAFVFIAPEDITLNAYMKRKSTAIQYK